MTLNSYPKNKTPRDKAFRQFLLKRPCELRFHSPCFGEMIYHHTQTGGMGLTGSDYAAISVCFGHHKLFDNASKKGVGLFTEDELASIISRNRTDYLKDGGVNKE